MAAKRKLKVTGQKPITNIKLRNGGTSTLYEVFAVTEEGGYVEEALRAFQELDVGQVLEYTIEPYNHPLHGMSYTLTPPKKETARRMRELEEQMQALIGWAEERGFNLQRALKPEPSPPDPAQAAEAEARKKAADAEADERFGEDPPFDGGAGDLGEELERHAKTGSTEPPEGETGIEI